MSITWISFTKQRMNYSSFSQRFFFLTSSVVLPAAKSEADSAKFAMNTNNSPEPKINTYSYNRATEERVRERTYMHTYLCIKGIVLHSRTKDTPSFTFDHFSLHRALYMPCRYKTSMANTNVLEIILQRICVRELLQKCKMFFWSSAVFEFQNITKFCISWKQKNW